jgi:hypothetical protein
MKVLPLSILKILSYFISSWDSQARLRLTGGWSNPGGTRVTIGKKA